MDMMRGVVFVGDGRVSAPVPAAAAHGHAVSAMRCGLADDMHPATPPAYWPTRPSSATTSRAGWWRRWAGRLDSGGGRPRVGVSRQPATIARPAWRVLQLHHHRSLPPGLAQRVAQRRLIWSARTSACACPTRSALRMAPSSPAPRHRLPALRRADLRAGRWCWSRGRWACAPSNWPSAMGGIVIGAIDDYRRDLALTTARFGLDPGAPLAEQVQTIDDQGADVVIEPRARPARIDVLPCALPRAPGVCGGAAPAAPPGRCSASAARLEHVHRANITLVRFMLHGAAVTTTALDEAQRPLTPLPRARRRDVHRPSARARRHPPEAYGERQRHVRPSRRRHAVHHQRGGHYQGERSHNPWSRTVHRRQPVGIPRLGPVVGYAVTCGSMPDPSYSRLSFRVISAMEGLAAADHLCVRATPPDRQQVVCRAAT